MTHKAFYVAPNQNVQGTPSYEPLCAEPIFVKFFDWRLTTVRGANFYPQACRALKAFQVAQKQNVQGTPSHEPLCAEPFVVHFFTHIFGLIPEPTVCCKEQFTQMSSYFFYCRLTAENMKEMIPSCTFGVKTSNHQACMSYKACY